MAKKAKKSKKLNKFAGVRRMYTNWHGMLECKSNNPDKVMCYFAGAWTAFNDRQAAHFLTLCNEDDFNTLMKYPIWE